jgi:hypothetical protein
VVEAVRCEVSAGMEVLQSAHILPVVVVAVVDVVVVAAAVVVVVAVVDVQPPA